MTLDQVLDAVGNGAVVAGVTHVGVAVVNAAFSKKTAAETIKSRAGMVGGAAIGALAGYLGYDAAVDPLMATVGAGVVGGSIGAAAWPVVHATFSTQRVQDRFRERAYQGLLVAGVGSALIHAFMHYF